MVSDVECGHCHGLERGAAVRVVLVFCPGKDAYPLIPGEDYHICPCGHAWIEFVKRAIASHPQVREWKWTEAIILMQDGKGKLARKVEQEFVGQA